MLEKNKDISIPKKVSSPNIAISLPMYDYGKTHYRKFNHQILPSSPNSIICEVSHMLVGLKI